VAWVVHNAEENAIVTEISRQRDRVAALMAAAMLEKKLEDAFKALIPIRSETVENRVFEGYGPLGSFAAKIDLGYLLGMFDAKTHKWLHTIKKIRNEFAHNPAKVTFKTQRIIDLCNNFPPPTPRRVPKLTKERFDEAKSRHNAIELVSMMTDSCLAGPNNSRTRYLGTVKLCLFLLEFALVSALNQMVSANNERVQEQGGSEPPTSH
jgi:hypothetical protein